jgi:hypothetical protein
VDDDPRLVRPELDHAEELADGDRQPGLLGELAGDGGRVVLAGLHPAAGDRPVPGVRRPPPADDEQAPAVVVHHPADATHRTRFGTAVHRNLLA